MKTKHYIVPVSLKSRWLLLRKRFFFFSFVCCVCMQDPNSNSFEIKTMKIMISRCEKKGLDFSLRPALNFLNLALGLKIHKNFEKQVLEDI